MADAGMPTPAEITENALAAFRGGDMDLALPMLRQAIEVNPEQRCDLLMHLGWALGRKEKWADAESAFNKATNEDGSNADAYYYGGVAIAKQGRLREAHGMFVIAVSLDPNHSKAKEAEVRTAKAAEQVTQEGSSSVGPASINLGLDLGEMLAAAKPAKPKAAPKKEPEPSADKGDKGGQAKKAGCGGGIVALLMLGLTCLWLLHALV